MFQPQTNMKTLARINLQVYSLLSTIITFDHTYYVYIYIYIYTKIIATATKSK